MLILAHGALGLWDEAIFIAVAVLFTSAVVALWRLSRRFEPDLDESQRDTAAESERKVAA